MLMEVILFGLSAPNVFMSMKNVCVEFVFFLVNLN